MNTSKIKYLVLTLVSMIAILVAQTSANACMVIWQEQPKIPQSLIKVD
ncbi:MAG: cyclic lactone autoinducer peptide [Clostridia bacterium]|nr:cyclic lactone autoinducer peptide [Clostridia bacterium]